MPKTSFKLKNFRSSLIKRTHPLLLKVTNVWSCVSTQDKIISGLSMSGRYWGGVKNEERKGKALELRQTSRLRPADLP
jgi:hypothetical protein